MPRNLPKLEYTSELYILNGPSIVKSNVTDEACQHPCGFVSLLFSADSYSIGFFSFFFSFLFSNALLISCENFGSLRWEEIINVCACPTTVSFLTPGVMQMTRSLLGRTRWWWQKDNRAASTLTESPYGKGVITPRSAGVSPPIAHTGSQKE